MWKEEPTQFRREEEHGGADHARDQRDHQKRDADSAPISAVVLNYLGEFLF